MECYNKVISPSEIIDYSNLIINNYERRSPGLLNSMPMVGFKVLMKDLDAYKAPGAERLRFIETYLPRILNGNGCIIRETNNNSMPDGFWLITLPVPITQLNDPVVNQIGRMLSVMDVLTREFNIVPVGMTEVNVSGRCTVLDTDNRIASVVIPEPLLQIHCPTENWACKLGTVVRINDGFMLLRTRWNMEGYDAYHRKEAMLLASNILSTIFR